MLFSLWHATMQAEQPTHLFKSIAIPHWCSPLDLAVSNGFGYIGATDGGFSRSILGAKSGVLRKSAKFASRTGARPSMLQ